MFVELSCFHLTDAALAGSMPELRVRESTATALILARIGEFDARRLFLPAACPSMFEYCVRELNYTEHSAYNRIRAARAARRFPVLLEAVADGRLHLTAVGMLAPHLTAATVDELVTAAARKTKAEIEKLLVERFARPEVEPRVRALPPPRANGLAAAGGRAAPSEAQLVPERVELGGNGRPPTAIPPWEQPPPLGQLVPERVIRPGKLTPLAPRRYAVQFSIDENEQNELRRAKDILSHQMPVVDVGKVYTRGLRFYLQSKLERSKFAATDRPRPAPGPVKPGSRHIPAHVRREVWARDAGQCTFVSKDGKRCASTERLEFDHIDEVARGGLPTVERMRVRCKAHNQYAAECAFGAEFMNRKRQESRTQGRPDPGPGPDSRRDPGG